MKRILWFRRDLRVEDNPLLSLGGEVLPVFIFDTQILNALPEDDKRVSFIFDRIIKLKKSLQDKGLDLKIFWGDPVEIFEVLEGEGFDEVVASGDYDAYAKERDIRVSHILHFRYLDDTYIFQPQEILKDDGTPYLVFTPFYHKAKTHFSKEHLQEYTFGQHTLYETSYEGITTLHSKVNEVLPLRIDSLGFTLNLPEIKDPKSKIESFQKRIERYQKERDYLDKEATSHLSIDLRFGTISVRSLLRFLVEQKNRGVDTEPFFRQLIFRDFYACLLFHFPDLATHNHKYRFNGLEDQEKYAAFCDARTGVPVVDAGIRELLQTGNMHNRVRMICASFFTKDLLLPWQWGESFYAKYLLDYDAASNILSWQWSAGTGIDPQPYFRIFNPYLQSKKFDKEAVYIKKWIPELRSVDAKKLHDENYLLHYTVEGYPKPMVVHKEASQNALAYFKQRL
jgi:deoxyribodipyrimidine photo-lyase